MIKLPLAMKNRSIRRFLIAQIPADFSDFMDFVAIGSLLAFTWGVAPSVYALLALGMALPYLIIGPFSGALVDRMPIRAVLIGTNLGRGLATCLLAFAPNWQVLILLVALRGTVDSAFTPAKQAALQSLTDEADRPSALGLSQSITEGSKIISPLLGGALLALIAPSSLFLVNGGLSFVAAILALRLGSVPKPVKDANAPATSLFQEVAEGWTTVWTSTTLRNAIFMMSAAMFVIFLYDIYIAPLLQMMGLKQFHLGVAIASVGTGGLIGAFIFSFGKAVAHPFRIAALGYAICACAMLYLSWLAGRETIVSLPLLAAIFATLGFFGSLGFIPLTMVLQATAPPDKIGRVSALNGALGTACMSFAPFLGSLMVAAGSFATPFQVGGALMGLLAIAAWVQSVRSSRQ